MELVEDGEIGQVKEAHVWFKRGGPNRAKLPEGSEPIPAHLDWDSWLGPLPWREYHPDWMRYDTWRETCTGMLGSFGNYASVFPFLALKVRRLWDQPPAKSGIRVIAECSSHNRVSFPRWERVRWEIPARGEMAPLTITWHNGPDYAPGTRELLRDKLRSFGVEDEAAAEDLLGEWGSMIIGETGAIVSQGHGAKITALPKARFPNFDTAKPTRIPPSRDWIDACRGDEKPHILADFDNGGPLSELLMLGEIATLYPEETLAYDPALGRITNKLEANQHVDFESRPGWEI